MKPETASPTFGNCSLAKWALALTAAGLVASRAEAGTIGITISATPELRDGALAVAIELANSGDEAAFSVTPTLRFRGKEARGESQTALGPDRTLTQSLELPAGELSEGRWPYSIAVDYTDANEYPFQALHVATLEVGSPLPAKVAVSKFESQGIAGTGTLDLNVRNLSGAQQKVRLGILVPDALEASAPGTELALDPWEEKGLEVSLTNRTAIAGSRYPIFVAVEYEDGAVHQALVAQGAVEILAAEPSGLLSRRLLWIGAGGVGLLVIGWLVVRARRS
ncbi:MAG: hypothetical protein L0206_19220 [Actinobacteria bacterium]|nr:hypothetical protein [Actinomycetota bacterium]